MSKSRANFDRNFRFVSNAESGTDGCGNCCFDNSGCNHQNVGGCGPHARIQDGGTECAGGFWVSRNGLNISSHPAINETADDVLVAAWAKSALDGMPKLPILRTSEAEARFVAAFAGVRRALEALVP